jgi:hypothetical protein
MYEGEGREGCAYDSVDKLGFCEESIAWACIKTRSLVGKSGVLERWFWHSLDTQNVDLGVS